MQRLPVLLPALLVFAGAVAATAPAMAQGGMRGPVRPNEQPQQRQAPAALPGLQGRRAAPVIPADPAQTATMSPNDALFDAISRGDLPAAREAVGRGADVEARNVLGLSPIDSAVDQGRSDILFYLLSVRGIARGGSGPPPQAAPAPRQTAAQRRAAEAAAREAERAQAGAARGGNQAVRTPRLWANDGGAPIPSVGFLGFDAGRSSSGPSSAGARSRGRG
jgi:hypothetical protein